MSKDLGIIICNFNKVDYLKGCLETLSKSNFKNFTYDIIVVDNASTDSSVNFVKKNHPEIILLQNSENLGGSGGFDRGIQYTIQKEYNYIVLLDNDILLESDTIINLINYIKQNPKVGVVGSKICTMDNPNILQEMGSFIDFEETFNIKTPFKGHFDNKELPEVVVCDYVPACCLVTTKEVLQKVGGFDTKHFIYWDDMDWCTRIKNLNYEIHAINSSKVLHKMGSANNTDTFGIYYFERNRILFFLKYLPESKFEKFVDKTCKWLVSLTFFCNLKGIYPKAISVLLSLDDLVSSNLGKQEESIFLNKKQRTLEELYNLKKEDKIILISQEDAFFNIIKNQLLNLHINNIDECKKFNSIHLSKYDKIFIINSHILECDNSIVNDNIIFVDKYLNSCESTRMNILKESYKNYYEIFFNIFKPVIEKKLRKIKDEY